MTDPLLSLLVQVPIGVATLIVFVVYMRQNAQQQKEAAQERKDAATAAAADRQRMLELYVRDSDRVEKLSNILQGFQPFLKGLVDNIRDFNIDTTTAVKVETNRVIAEVGKVPDASAIRVEPVVKTALDEAVTRSIKHQDENASILRGHVELESGKVIERIDASGGSLAARLDNVLGQMLLMVTKEEYAEHKRDLLTEMVAIKSAVARIEAAQTRPLPPLVTTPEPSAVTTNVVAIDVAQPPSLIIEHAKANDAPADDDRVKG